MRLAHVLSSLAIAATLFFFAFRRKGQSITSPNSHEAHGNRVVIHHNPWTTASYFTVEAKRERSVVTKEETQQLRGGRINNGSRSVRYNTLRQKRQRHQKSRVLPGNEWGGDFKMPEIGQLDSSQTTMLFGVLFVLLILWLLCCCCGCSVWDLLMLYCCCQIFGGGGGDLGESFF